VSKNVRTASWYCSSVAEISNEYVEYSYRGSVNDNRPVEELSVPGILVILLYVMFESLSAWMLIVLGVPQSAFPRVLAVVKTTP